MKRTRKAGDPTAVDLAYCAGVLDSDGTIGIRRSTYSMRVVKDSEQATYSERLSVKQVEPQAVSLLWSLFGGSLYVQRGSVKNGRALHSWTITDLRAARCLRLVLPYLRIKREQAINCLNLRDVKDRSKAARVAPGRGHVGSARRSPEFTAAMETLHRRARDLNVVGVRA